MEAHLQYKYLHSEKTNNMLFLFKMVTCKHFDQPKAYNQKIITVGLVEL